jgi:hypothetical protein
VSGASARAITLIVVNTIEVPPSLRTARRAMSARGRRKQAAALEYLPDARGRYRRRCGRCLAWPHRTHDTGGLRAGHRRPPDRCVDGVLGKRGRTELGQMTFAPSTSANHKPALNTSSKRVFLGGAKGIRTPALTRQIAVNCGFTPSRSESVPLVTCGFVFGS